MADPNDPKDVSLRLAHLEARCVQLRRQSRVTLALLVGTLALGFGGIVAGPLGAQAVDSLIFYTRTAPAGPDVTRLVIPTDADPVTCRFENSSVNLVSGGLQTAGTGRLTNGGALTAITNYTQTTGAASITSSSTTGNAVLVDAASMTTGTGLNVSVSGGATGSYAARFSGGKIRLPLFASAAEPPTASAAAGDVFYESTENRLRLFQPGVGGGPARWRYQGAEVLGSLSSTGTTPIPTTWTTLGAAAAANVPGLYVVTLTCNRPSGNLNMGLRLQDTTLGLTRAHIQIQDNNRSSVSATLYYDKTSTTAESLAVQWAGNRTGEDVPAGNTVDGLVLNSLAMTFVRFGR